MNTDALCQQRKLGSVRQINGVTVVVLVLCAIVMMNLIVVVLVMFVSIIMAMAAESHPRLMEMEPSVMIRRLVFTAASMSMGRHRKLPDEMGYRQQ